MPAEQEEPRIPLPVTLWLIFVIVAAGAGSVWMIWECVKL